MCVRVFLKPDHLALSVSSHKCRRRRAFSRDIHMCLESPLACAVDKHYIASATQQVGGGLSSRLLSMRWQRNLVSQTQNMYSLHVIQ